MILYYQQYFYKTCDFYFILVAPEIFIHWSMICLIFELFSKGAAPVKLDNHVLMHTVRKSDDNSAFLSRLHQPVWSWHKTTRVNTFLWRWSANLKRRRMTKSCRCQNVAPTGNNWLPTTGAAWVTMGKAPYLPGCQTMLEYFQNHQQYVLRLIKTRSGSKLITSMAYFIYLPTSWIRNMLHG